MNALVFASGSFLNAVLPGFTGIIGWLIGGGGGTGTASGLVQGNATTARFNSPSKLTTDNTNLYITDSSNNNIRQVVISGPTASLLAGSSSSTPGYADGVGTSALFNNPNGVAYDGAGNLFVADASNNLIRQIVISTGTVSTLAGGLGSTTSGSANGVGTNATFNGPKGICYDGSGNLFVADTSNNRIRQIVISSATVSTLAGSGAASALNGVGTNATFNGPQGICYKDGNLYIADSTAGTIRTIVVSTATVATYTGITRYNLPTDIYPDNSGNLLITDKPDCVVYKLQITPLNPAVSTVFAGARAAGYVNGTGATVRFNGPSGIVINSAFTKGYICDCSNNMIRTIT
jgi:hypothetical protein